MTGRRLQPPGAGDVELWHDGQFAAGPGAGLPACRSFRSRVPVAGATLATGQATQLTASATSPNDGCTISKVEFYAKLGAAAPALVGTAVGSPPYQVGWTPANCGAYTLTAKVFDQRDVTATSSGVAVTVNAASTVYISAPAANQVFAPNSTIAITAVPADADGTIAKVEFYQGTTLLGTRTGAPWTHSWASVPKGNYSLTAKAFDNLNASTTSAAVPIIVSLPPTVSITSPAANALYASGQHHDQRKRVGSGRNDRESRILPGRNARCAPIPPRRSRARGTASPAAPTASRRRPPTIRGPPRRARQCPSSSTSCPR